MLFDLPALLLKPDVRLLSGFAKPWDLRPGIDAVIARAPLRHLDTPMGTPMAVAMSNCGALGWVSDARGYRYTAADPLTQRVWPDMPQAFADLATQAAASAGWPNFNPDACLINHYSAGAGMGLHQDRDEQDLGHPIVSVSIGATARFMIGGLRRSDPVRSVDVHDGDVIVWGNTAHLIFHGVRPVRAQRWNLTFRRAG